MAGEEVPWPPPPRDPGPWNGGPPVAPPGNTPLPPLPGAGGVVHGAAAASNPWGATAPAAPQAGRSNPNVIPQVNIPPERRGPSPATAPVPAGPGQALVDRAPIGILVASALVVLALVAGVVYLVLKGGREYPEAWDARVQPITEWVAKERGLAFAHPVQVNFLTEEQYTAASTEGADSGVDEQEQFYADQLAQLRALGFVTGDVDLGEANKTLSDSGTLAYYDPDLEQVFVRGTKMTPALEVTLAHELTHVLQDQNFDLSRMEDLDSGRAAVLRALAEGDATKVEDAYVDEELTEEERAAYEKESAQSGDEAVEELEDKVPGILTTTFAAPYILGPELIEFLDLQDGWKAINDAELDPPTEEAMFDPTLYDTKAAEPVEVSVSAPKGAEVITRDEFGPTSWYLLLASRLDPLIALGATDGWGGDEYVLYRTGDTVCLDAVIATDTETDRGELEKALGAWAAKSPKDTAKVSADGDRIQFQSCDPGKDAKSASSEVTPDLLTLPVTRTILYSQAIEAGRDKDEAACFGNGVIKRFTFSQLNDPEGAFIQSAKGQQILQEIRTECFS